MNLPMRLLLVSAMLTLAACATTSPAGRGKASAQTPEKIITERAIARWDGLIKRDPATAWTYLSPGYRATHPQDVYAEEMTQRPVRWTKVDPFKPIEGQSQVDAVECDESFLSCDVRLRVRFKIRSHLTSVGVVESVTVIKENWIKIKGQWYFVPPDVVR